MSSGFGLAARVADVLARPRAETAMLGAFSTLALLLAALGVYGVLMFAVAGRYREFAVRAALGADRRALVRLVLWDTGLLVAGGILPGIATAAIAARLLRHQLFGVAPPASSPWKPCATSETALSASVRPETMRLHHRSGRPIEASQTPVEQSDMRIPTR